LKAVFMPNRRDDGLLRIAEEHPELDWTIACTAEERAAAIVDAEILILAEAVCCAELGKLIMSARKLRWIQFSTAGIDQCVRFGLPTHIPITSGSGIKAPTIAEHAMGLLLALTRRLRDLESERAARRWSRNALFPKIDSLEDRTLVIIGYGHIGQDIARKAKAFDMRTIVVSRAAQPGPNVDEILPRTRLGEALARADAVVICTQASPETDKMIGKAELERMKPSAVVVNVARGEMIDESAMIVALNDGRIAGAALDVTLQEPLPADHPLWRMDNVLISPHVAGGGGDRGGYKRFAARFAENLRRLKAGEPLLLRIDPAELARSTAEPAAE
jgi:phosphoglycerate dehydrogenase-like enzyme